MLDIALAQLCLWMETPKPRVMKPTMGSPGRASSTCKLDGGVVEALHHHAVGGMDAAQIDLRQILHRLVLSSLGGLELLPLLL